MTFKLRDYQAKAHDELITRFRNNEKTLMALATGAGKSKTVVSFIKRFYKHYIFILVVKNRKLVNQLAEDTKIFGLDYGVFMANHDEFKPDKEIQVCSVDTINTRGIHPHITSNKPLVLIIDEADQAKASTYQAMINRYLNRSEGRTFLMGMTATPYNGLDFFDSYFVPISPLELKKRGVLVGYKYYIPKESIDYDGVRIQRGEWRTKDVTAKLNTPKMIQNAFNSWLKYGDNRQTLLFCMDKKHAIAFCEHINNYYDRPLAKFVYDKTPDFERQKIFKEFQNGIIRFLVNIRIITRGVDIPCIGTILDCAATLNTNLHIQKLGRGSRSNDFYDDCIVIDMAKNCINNGHFYQERKIDLSVDERKTKAALEVLQMRVCDNCFRAAPPEEFGKSNICPFCNFKNRPLKKTKLSKHKQEQVFLENATEEQIAQRQMIKEFKKLLWQYQNLGKRYSHNIAKEKAHLKLMKNHGKEKVLSVRYAIGISDETIYKFEALHEYKPLDGANI